MDTVQAIVEYRAACEVYRAASKVEKELLQKHSDAAETVYQAKRAYNAAELALLKAAAGE